MPFYNDLRPSKDFDERDFVRVRPDMQADEKLRCIDGLLRLKRQLEASVSARRTEDNLLVASWNIVSLGSGDYRTGEALYYLAEILSRFDLIVVQEVKPSLADLDRLIRILGPNWAYMVNDATGGDEGNDERSAYIYNTNRVRPSGIAGELSIWNALAQSSPLGLRDLKRPAYMTGFVTGWKQFALINLHLHPGKDAEKRTANAVIPADSALRQEEMRLLLSVLADRMDKLWTQNLVLVGDMNFYRTHDDATIDLIHAAGFWESAGLVGKTTNITTDPADAETYDRMFFNGDDYFRIATVDGQEQGGVLNPFLSVYRDEDWPAYRSVMRDKHGTPAKGAALMTDDGAAIRYFKQTFRKRQLSDHFLIWVELAVDDSAAFLAGKRPDVAADLPGG
jgi:endonuclease/exonuclease/phosphatase family metal-dependent hydrolase